uniref:Uncharacterized protein n=1 Tax=Anguilla anguilla TaxID=7936 RepID=A0A0E9TQV8_ANGAN
MVSLSGISLSEMRSLMMSLKIS